MGGSGRFWHILLVLWLLTPAIGLGQTHVFRKYTSDDGLASSLVYRCMQDSRGFIWFGTESGVSRFDGRNFDNFTSESGLADNEVFNIHEDSRGRIWFMTFNGKLSFYHNGKIHNEYTDPFLKKAALASSGSSFFEDSRGNVWIGAYDGEITRIADEKVYKYAPDLTRSVGHFIEDSQHQLYCFKGKIRYNYNPETDQFTVSGSCPHMQKDTFCYLDDTRAIYYTIDGVGLIKDGQASLLCPLNIPSVLYLHARNEEEFFVCSRASGVVLKDVDSGAETWVIKDEAVNFVMLDNEGNLWFCTQEYGVWMIPSGQFDVKVWNEDVGMPKNTVYDILSDHYGRIWMACNDNMVYCSEDTALHAYHLPEGSSIRGRVLGLAETSAGDIVASGDGGLFVFDSARQQFKHVMHQYKSGLRPSAGTKQLLTGSGRTVFTGGAGGLLKLDLADPELIAIMDTTLVSRRRVMVGFIDSSNQFWISTTEGLECYASDTPCDEGRIVLTERVLAITETTDGTLVCATEGPGLLLLYEGMPTDTLQMSGEHGAGIFRDLDSAGDTVWAAGNKGVAMLLIEKGKIREVSTMSLADGLLSSKARSVLVAGNCLHVGTDRGMSVIPLSKAALTQTVPSLYIRSIHGTWGVINTNEPVELDYLNNNITVEFSAITFKSPRDVIYEYRLNPEAGWVNTSGRVITLSNLQYQEHTLELRARNPDGQWSEIEAVRFSVAPPFWRTTVFYVLAGMMVASLLIYLVSLRYTRTLRRMNAVSIVNAERSRISADLHDDIGADLSKIVVSSELLKNDSSAGVNPHVSKILESARNLRGKADDIIWALNPSNNSLGSMSAYLRKLGTDFFEGTEIQFEQHEHSLAAERVFSSLERRNLFLMVKELFNNSLKHSGATEVKLHITDTGKLLVFDVSDNGKGLDMAQVNWRNGGKTIRQRAEEIGAVVNWTQSDSGGLKVSISMESGKRHQMKI
ncbi:MAG: hypothetical protein JNM00_01615 [Flavobacteriales bacterium]|nr:hypothetical protein [Flavobacteriales bacterium]